MTDNELRGIVLRMFYDLRADEGIYRLDADELGTISNADYNRIGRQLGEKGLIEWHTSLSQDGRGRITGYGVDVIEGVTPIPGSITLFDHSVSIHGSHNVQIGNSNSLNANTNIDVQKIMNAIDKSDAPADKKTRPKALSNGLRQTLLLQA